MKTPLTTFFLAFIALAVAAPAVMVTTTSAAPSRPNVIVILTDDQGYHDVGFNGCKDIPTPNLDSIAGNGVRFTSGYVTYSVCSPSRAGLLTGRYPQRFGYERNPRWNPRDPTICLTVEERTLADVLGQAGYHSGIIGKWHLGAHPNFHPQKRGFNEFFGMIGGGHRYFPEETTLAKFSDARNEGESYRTPIMRGDTPAKTTQYLTDEFSDEAVSFVERNKDQPFFLYLAYNAPHAPLQAPEKYLSRFTSIKNPKRRTYAAMVSAVDDGVGRLLAKLRELGLERNTIVFFLSDNGGPTPDNASDNYPLRGHKGNTLEGGWRVPFAVQWPGRIPAGQDYDHPVSSLDIFATAVAFAEAKTDPARPLDGVNIVPFLTKEKQGAPHDAVYLRMHDKGGFAVRQGDFKLHIPNRSTPTQLYNLAEDIGEKNNLADTHPDKLSKLEQLRSAWNAQLIPPAFAGLESEKPNKKPAKENPAKTDPEDAKD